MEDEMGMASAVDADHERAVHHLMERQIVFDNILGKFHPVIAFIVANEKGGKQGVGPFSDPMLRENSILALCRYMCVSNGLCELYLPLLFTALDRESVPSTRTTIMIALADLSFRFPNALEPWINRMYGRLSDDNAYVRFNTLMVLTHLILNDMIKVKGQVSHVVVCLTDRNEKVRDLATLFFIKLSERSNNPVYNLLGDIIATFSRDRRTTHTPANITTSITTSIATEGDTVGMSSEGQGEKKEREEDGGGEGEGEGKHGHDSTHAMDVDAPIYIPGHSEGLEGDEGENDVVAVATVEVDESSLPSRILSTKEFQLTLHFLLSFVKKDKQADVLFERLIVRLGMAQTIVQRRHLSFCISELSVSQKGLKKLVELFRFIKVALHDAVVFECIRGTVAKAKKSLALSRGGGGAGGGAGDVEQGPEKEVSAPVSSKDTKAVIEELETLLKEFGTLKSSSSGVGGEGEGEGGEDEEDGEGGIGEDEEDEGTKTKKKKGEKDTSDKKETAIGKKGRSTRATKKDSGKSIAKKGSRGKKKEYDSDDESEEEEEEEDDDEPPSKTRKEVPKRTPSKQVKKKLKKGKKGDDDDAEDDEDEMDF